VTKRVWARIHKPVPNELCDDVVRKEAHETEGSEGDEHEIAYWYVIEDETRGREPPDPIEK